MSKWIDWLVKALLLFISQLLFFLLCEVFVRIVSPQIHGWDFKFDPGSGIHELPTGETSKQFSGGGIFTLKKAKLPFLTLFIKIKNIEEKAKLIEQEGGFITIEPVEIPGGSKICLFNEPSGVTFAMIEKIKE